MREFPSTWRDSVTACRLVSLFASFCCCCSSLSTSPVIPKLVPPSNAYAATHAVQIESRTDDGTRDYRMAPVSLLPNAFPRDKFELARSLAPSFNLLVDRMSRDADFLCDTLAEVVTADPFTGRLLDMYRELYGASDDDGGSGGGNFAKAADQLGILRSDYMLNSCPTDDDDDSGALSYSLKQVELNTIASSFAGLATNVAGMHRYLVARFGDDDDVKAFLASNVQTVTGHTDGQDGDGVPHNPALENLAQGMALAHEHYRATHQSNKDVVVLFVVQEGETNTVDQRLLEFRLWEQHGVPVLRMSLQQIQRELVSDPHTGALTTLPSSSSTTTAAVKEIGVVYFRAGYAPTDYPTEECWEARRLLESSRATKCPNLGTHLAGTKKVQQTLARPGSVERFVRDEAQALRGAFAGLYSLASRDMTAEDEHVVRAIITTDDDAKTTHHDVGTTEYVLKPQREGGGYNYYGDDMRNKLREHVRVADDDDDGSLVLDDELAEFILMERLFPPRQTSVLLRAGNVEGEGDSISELGIFGCVLSTNAGGDEENVEVLHNEYAGFLLRTKFVGVDEGGVASGFATLSSPYLC